MGIGEMLWISDRNWAVWIAHANGFSYAAIGRAFGISAGRAHQIDAAVQATITLRMERQLEDVLASACTTAPDR